jgi:Mannosyltransferase (PIG-V)
VPAGRQGVAEQLGLAGGLTGYVLAVFAVSRAGFVLLTVLSIRFLHPYGPTASSSFISAWSRWDATYYARLATADSQPSLLYRTAFFPLQPLATRLVLPVVGGNGYVATMVVANVSFLAALLGIAALAHNDYDAGTARRAVLYLTLFPTALFTFAGYAESLFLALAIWCFVAVRHGWWWQAGVLGLLASMTRQMGLFLMLPVAYEYGARGAGWRLRQLRLDALWVMLIPTGLFVFMGWLWITVGDPLAFVHAEKHWSHVLELPWVTLWQALHVLLTSGGDRVFQFRATVDVAAVSLVAVLLVAGIHKMRAGDILYSASVWLLAVAYPVLGWPLQSDARYMLAAFPCLMLLAHAGRTRWLHGVVLVAFGSCLLIMTQYFVRGAVIL